MDAAVIGGDISHGEFARMRDFFQSVSGIKLADCKKILVCGRLSRRLRHYRFATYEQYLDFISQPQHADERQMAIDLLTTNETHFFREPKHFAFFEDLLRQLARRPGAPAVRIWSAASSTGEEPYSLAMVLAEVLGVRNWSVLGSDLSSKVLADARQAIYPSSRIDEIPAHLVEKYVLEGVDEFAGFYRMDTFLRQRVNFQQINLMQPLPGIGPFDAVFLRNVLIYFDRDSKRRIVESVAQKLQPGGLLFIGHSETLNGVTDAVTQVAPTIYQRLPG